MPRKHLVMFAYAVVILTYLVGIFMLYMDRMDVGRTIHDFWDRLLFAVWLFIVLVSVNKYLRE